jgi:Asp-tRNA(Asn)/Glu-tRNA(Gln) amidotransferase C subunit
MATIKATDEERDYVKKRINKILGYVNPAQPTATQPQSDTDLELYVAELSKLNDLATDEDREKQRKEQLQALAKIIRNPYITKPFIDRITQVGSDAGKKLLYVIHKMFNEQIVDDPELNLIIKEYVDDTPNRNNSLLHGYSVELEKKPYTADDEVQFLLRILARSMQNPLPNPNPNPNPNPLPDKPPNEPLYGTYTRKAALNLHKKIAEGGGRKKGGKSKRKHRKRSNAKKRGSKKTIKKH